MKADVKSLIFDYPELPNWQKEEFEREILKAPYSLELTELSHLLKVGFPFNRFQLRWLTKYEELGFMVQERGCFPVLPRVQPLAGWISNQRSRKKMGKVLVDREMALNRIGFVWEPEDHEWNVHYESFVRYMKGETGSASLLLRSWMSKTRARWNKLTTQQRRLLREAGMTRDPLKQRAQTNLSELEVIYERQGSIEGLPIRLSHFVRRLRYLHQTGKLDTTTKNRCDRMSMEWTTFTAKEQELHWNQRYAQVTSYVDQFSGEVPSPSKWENRELGKWVASQTKRWKTMSPERQALLRKIRVVEKHEREWITRYKDALALFLKLGPYRGKAYQNEDRSLKRWIARQRVIWDGLSEYQQDRLRAIGLEKNDGELGAFRKVKNALRKLGDPA